MVVKSALEIAMEKSAKINVDPEVFKKIELKKLANKALNELFDKPEGSFLNKIGSCDRADLNLFTKICEEILLGKVELPVSQEGFNFVKRCLAILGELKSGGGEAHLTQLFQVLDHYQIQKKQVLERLKQQSESGRTQMQKRLAKQLGADMNVPIESDPTYQKNKEQVLNQLGRQYSYEIQRIKEQIMQLQNIY